MFESRILSSKIIGNFQVPHSVVPPVVVVEVNEPQLEMTVEIFTGSKLGFKKKTKLGET